MARKYRKKPVVIEAVQFRGPIVDINLTEVIEFLGDDFIGTVWVNPDTPEVHIRTLEGEIVASLGDYIIRGVANEHYPCKPDIFEQTYEPVTDTLPTSRVVR